MGLSGKGRAISDPASLLQSELLKETYPDSRPGACVPAPIPRIVLLCSASRQRSHKLSLTCLRSWRPISFRTLYTW